MTNEDEKFRDFRVQRMVNNIKMEIGLVNDNVNLKRDLDAAQEALKELTEHVAWVLVALDEDATPGFVKWEKEEFLDER